MGVIKEDIWSLDYSSHGLPRGLGFGGVLKGV